VERDARAGPRGVLRGAAKVLPARQIASADEVADAVVLAATNPSITGTVLEIDGGARLFSLG